MDVFHIKIIGSDGIGYGVLRKFLRAFESVSGDNESRCKNT